MQEGRDRQAQFPFNGDGCPKSRANLFVSSAFGVFERWKFPWPTQCAFMDRVLFGMMLVESY
jgi:hypothetical protein